MSLEDDHDHLAERMKTALIEAQRAAQAAFPDALVFALQGSEIRTRLLELADKSETEAIAEEEALRRIGRPRPATPTPAFGGPYEPDQEYLLAVAKERIEALRENVKTLRFLAAHVEEDRYFRLCVQDLAFLNLVPYSVHRSHGPVPMPVGRPIG